MPQTDPDTLAAPHFGPFRVPKYGSSAVMLDRDAKPVSWHPQGRA